MYSAYNSNTFLNYDSDLYFIVIYIVLLGEILQL